MPEPRTKRAVRNLTVVSCEMLSTNMKRITLGGEDLADFPENQESGYIKLLLPCDGEEPFVRTYTIRRQRPVVREIDVDFALHEGDAPASSWAAAAKAGDQISITGPGPKKLVDFSADWFLIAGDMTALPAIGVNVENLPETARGYVVVEVLSEGDKIDLKPPKGLSVHWVVNPHPGQGAFPLVEAVESLEWIEGRPSIWAACEFSSMQKLRKFFKQDREVGKRDLYVSSYWKHGISEDHHKRVKRKDSEENGS